MNPERWQRVKQLLEEAIALNAVERASFLDVACDGDIELRREIDSLLASHEQAGTDFLETAVVNLSAGGPGPMQSGRRIGVYQIVEEIGRGGMGEVYRAVRADGQYTKEVAVKLVRGGLDSASVQQGFRNERQILASLDHPNIGRLLDGGTTEDGIPYLVMELIEGIRIDAYCDDHKLSITERLRLFRQVCSAVQFAHQRLVIHRDIKPSNILVTKEGVPKLLDFGIAKILDPAGLDADATVTIARAMTPEYASPEQVRGEPITTASDVYSLGVVLYQLLTGRSPYPAETRTSLEMARAVCDTDPGRPSTAVLKVQVVRSGVRLEELTPEQVGRLRETSPAKLHRRLAGDLDNIVLMALRKEPTRRYASVEQFSEDIRRHLEALPVTAVKDSWAYRTDKFVKRHRAAVAVTVTATLALAAGVGVVVREARIASENQRVAEKRFNDVRKLANSLMFEIHDSIRDLPGSTPARKLLVSRSLEYLDSLNQQSKGDASLQRELASAYQRVGDVLGYPYIANLGDSVGALQSYRKAIAILEPLAASHPEDTQLQGVLADDYFRSSNVLESTGDFHEALNTMKKALPLTERLAASNTGSTRADILAGNYYFTAGLLSNFGDAPGAADSYRHAASIRQAALKTDPENASLRTHLAADYCGIAKAVFDTGDFDQAVQMQTKGVDILGEVSAARPNNATLREFLGEAIDRLAGFYEDHGVPIKALDYFHQSHEIFENLLAADPRNFLAKSNFGFSENGIARALLSSGNPESAQKAFRKAAQTFEELSPSTSKSRYVRTGLADSYFGLGSTFAAWATQPHRSTSERRQFWQEARSWFQKSSAVWAEKERLGEIESSERDAVAKVAKSLAECDAELKAKKPVGLGIAPATVKHDWIIVQASLFLGPN